MATISTQEYLLDQAKRRFTPSINNFPGMAALERKLLNTKFPESALAEPPNLWNSGKASSEFDNLLGVRGCAGSSGHRCCFFWR